MENLANCDLEPLPIIFSLNDNINKFNINFKNFNSIFDGASIGQYLGGVDKKNDINDTRGFINETCIVKYNNFKFQWIQENNLYKPYLLYFDNISNQDIKIPIINLHIHSKELFKFMSNNPLETKYIEKLN